MTAIMMWKKNRNLVADDEYINFSMTFTPIILTMILSNKEIREQYYNQYFVRFTSENIHTWLISKIQWNSKTIFFDLALFH